MAPKTIQLILPMAGKGSRFSEIGYLEPKPMLPIGDFPMFLTVLANVYDIRIYSITIVKQESLELNLDLKALFTPMGIKVNLVNLLTFTDGAASTVEFGLTNLDSDLPVVIVNSDQYVVGNLVSFYDALVSGLYSGVILGMNDTDPKWSYMRLNKDGFVSEVVEKVVVSNLATVGIYGFASAQLCRNAISLMKELEFRVNGEFYVAPAYNFLPADSKPIHHINLGAVGDVMFGLGIPIDYESFLSSPILGHANLHTKNIFGDKFDKS